MANANESGQSIRFYLDNSNIQFIFQIGEYDLQSIENDVEQFPLSSAKQAEFYLTQECVAFAISCYENSKAKGSKTPLLDLILNLFTFKNR